MEKEIMYENLKIPKETYKEFINCTKIQPFCTFLELGPSKETTIIAVDNIAASINDLYLDESNRLICKIKPLNTKNGTIFQQLLNEDLNFNIKPRVLFNHKTGDIKILSFDLYPSI